MAACYLTTIDNEIDPSVDFDAWYFNDTNVLGYDTCSKIANVALTLGWNDELPDEQQKAIIEDAIDELIRCDFLGIFVKIKKESD